MRLDAAARFVGNYTEVHNKLLVFGTQKNIEFDRVKEEEKAMKNKLPFILLPTNKFRKVWNFVVLVLLLYTAIFVPY